LEVQCSCGLGVYIFKTPNEIPNESLICQNCGKYVIQYTNKNDDEIEYDGNLSNRYNIIFNEIEKKLNNSEEE
jgi:hypothetical protein